MPPNRFSTTLLFILHSSFSFIAPSSHYQFPFINNNEEKKKLYLLPLRGLFYSCPTFRKKKYSLSVLSSSFSLFFLDLFHIVLLFTAETVQPFRRVSFSSLSLSVDTRRSWSHPLPQYVFTSCRRTSGCESKREKVKKEPYFFFFVNTKQRSRAEDWTASFLLHIRRELLSERKARTRYTTRNNKVIVWVCSAFALLLPFWFSFSLILLLVFPATIHRLLFICESFLLAPTVTS